MLLNYKLTCEPRAQAKKIQWTDRSRLAHAGELPADFRAPGLLKKNQQSEPITQERVEHATELPVCWPLHPQPG